MSTLYEAVIALALLALIGLAVWGTLVVFFFHTHDSGHCGWSGCQSKKSA